MFSGRFSIHCVRACRIKETGGIVGRRGVQLFGRRSVGFPSSRELLY